MGQVEECSQLEAPVEDLILALELAVILPAISFKARSQYEDNTPIAIEESMLERSAHSIDPQKDIDEETVQTFVD